MRIGFDAKRAFFNRSGLGNYSRDVIKALVYNFPENEYFLYSPTDKKVKLFIDPEKITVGLPSIAKGKFFGSYWRSFLLSKRLHKDRINIYHGLSNELPNNIRKSGTKSVVTIHDLIFVRHPEWYKPVDRKIYEKKFKYSSRCADKIVAVSQQTKSDLIEYFGIEENKITVIYQGCNEIFMQKVTHEITSEVLKKYGVPDKYILTVGTIEERKNLLQIIKALHQGHINFPLVAVGKPTSYLNEIKRYISKNKVKGITLLHNVPLSDLPALYQNAAMFIYPSVFEGFGIPILEALWSGVPVITSKGGCFSEAGGTSSIYIDPGNPGEIYSAINELLTNSHLCQSIIDDGYKHAHQFTTQDSARQIMELYFTLGNG
jgi:glycosyltransferase involved in cell wall biosynthesis